MAQPRMRLLAGVALIAGGALALEVGFTRIFSVAIWYHFAYLVVGVAQLGAGAAGAYLAARPRDAEALVALLPRLALAFAGQVLTAIAVVALVRFDPLHLSGPALVRTAVGLSLYAASLLGLFFTAGLYLACAFTLHADSAHRLYFADLGGACVATALTLHLMLRLDGLGLLFAIALAALAAAACAGGLRGSLRLVGAGLTCLSLGGLVLSALGHAPRVPVPRSKELAAFLRAEGVRAPEITVWDPAARLDVLPPYRPTQNNVIGGLSPAHRPSAPPLLRRRVTFDGTSNAQVLGWDGRTDSIAFLRDTIAAAPFHLAPPQPRVLSIGVGGGMDLLLALAHGASHTTGVELNATLVQLLRGPLARFSGGLALRPDVQLVAAEGRSFLERTPDHFDVIQGLGVDNFAALASGAYVLCESYLYTVEAFRQILRHLTPQGVFAWTRSVDWPPREMLRLVVLAREALAAEGVTHPAAHLALVAASDEPYGTLLLARQPLGPRMARLRAFSERTGFPLLIDPDRPPGTIYERYLHDPAPQAFWRRYRYDISPVHDDRPFFYNYFRWRDLLAPPRGATGDVNLRLPVAYVVLLLLLVAALAGGAAVVLGPLLHHRRQGLVLPGAAALLGYFGLLGLGYIAVQSLLIQRLTLVIGYPTLAITVTIAAMLASSGLGSLLSPWLCRDGGGLRRVLLGIVAGLAVLPWVLPPLGNVLLQQREPLRVLGASALIAPLGFLMGMPFPTGLRQVSRRAPLLVGWAWALNGVAAVLGSTVVVLLSMQAGLRTALAVAVAAYAGALLLAPRLYRSSA
ncbi:MAG: hypothetical protein RMK29_13445 [Myxococcales bacterium]|nr:hypothetical protein [Myxococcota bacterium]MDW8282712.1 hypothetical protein [Myxococcales bacterium]